jgi:hypothetical protein
MKFNCRALFALMLGYTLSPSPVHAQFSQQAKLVGTGAIGSAIQGTSVTLSRDGNTASFGGPNDNKGIGAAWVFTRSHGAWSQQAKLVGTGVIGNRASQGYSVSLSGDGNTVVVGGPVDHRNTGAVWVLTRSRDVWSQKAKLVGAGSVGMSHQGWSAALSNDGNTIIVGGPFDNNGIGAAWVFARSPGGWSQQAKLIGGGAIGHAEQGFSVALSGDGNTAIVEGFSDHFGHSGPPVGAAWVFTRSQGVWRQQTKIAGALGSVSLSDDGKTAMVGAIGYRQSVARVLTRARDVWRRQTMLVGVNGQESLSGSGDRAIIAEEGVRSGNDTGAALVFTRLGDAWRRQAKLIGSGEITKGVSVSLSGDGNIAMIGQPDSNNFAGAAWVFAQIFVGTPGKADCVDSSVAALAQHYSGLNPAATALGYSNISALQSAILMFCGR